MAQQIELTSTVKESQLGQRLDQAAAELFSDFSRSRIKEWLLAGKITVNGSRELELMTAMTGYASFPPLSSKVFFDFSSRLRGVIESFSFCWIKLIKDINPQLDVVTHSHEF